MRKLTGVFDTSDEVTKNGSRDINTEPEMIELKRMIRAGELDAKRIRQIDQKTEATTTEDNKNHNVSEGGNDGTESDCPR